MKLKFKTQAYQSAAVQAVADCLEGQPRAASTPGRGAPGTVGHAADLFPDEPAFGNAALALTDARLLDNVQRVQRAQGLPVSPALVTTEVARLNLDVEMETGTGKTYCYLKTIFELDRRYGWRKFVIVVPSIAIREGVARSLEITAAHFLESYGKKARFFIYDSRQLHHLESFASDAGINVMVINAQAFAARGADNRRIYEVLDDFQSRRPIDVIAACRPVLILDEPQKMEGAQTLKSLAAFDALMVLRYSATHKTTHNKIHRLDALDAYAQKLVKKIAVRGIAVRGVAGASGYLYLQSIDVSRTKPPEARVEFEQKRADGSIRRVPGRLVQGSRLFELSKGLDQYQGLVVAGIDAGSDTLGFTNGVTLSVGEAVGDVNESTLRRLQIREAIQAHLDKEQALFRLGVKVLTLFFIDEVAKYRDYAAADEKGAYARVFEEEYARCIAESGSPLDASYAEYLRALPAAKTHQGYFSIDRKTRRLADPAAAARGENAGLSDDADAYDLILRDKERLLSLDEPVRFLFSHSALREGWDNPNVFVICTLKHSDNTVSRRQEVGRGLRLSVNQRGERMDDPALVHDVNVLTVVASESYKDFVAALQRDLGESLAARPGAAGDGLLPEIVDDRRARRIALNANVETPEFRALWSRINRQAAYRVDFDPDELVRSAAEALGDPQTGLRVAPLQYTIQRGEQAPGATHAEPRAGQAFELKTTKIETDRTATRSVVTYDLVGKLADGTQLSRRTIADILKSLDASVFAQFEANPEHFIAEAIRLVNERKAAVLIPGLAYDVVDRRHGLDLFEAASIYRDPGQGGKPLQRHIADHVATDSEVERAFVAALESSPDVLVYAKLPRGFLIPTPVGQYHPDWAIAFREGSTRHRHLVVETKGATSRMALRGIELAKIDCARKFFAAMSAQGDGEVGYLVVDSFERLMALTAR